MTERSERDSYGADPEDLRLRLDRCQQEAAARRDEWDAKSKDLLSGFRQAQRYDRGFRNTRRRRELIELVRESRRARDDEQPTFDFDILPAQRDYPVVVVLDELLIRTRDLTERAGQLVRNAGLTPEPVEGLDGRVLRLRAEPAPVGRLAELAKALHREGVPVSFDYISPLAVVMKGEGGIEESAWHEPSQQVERGGVRVGIIDTGRSAEVRRDGWLTGVSGDEDPLYIDAERTLGPGGGHGQFVAGIVRQVAPRADVKVYRALDQWGVGREADVASAMFRAAREGLGDGHKVVLNLSFGVQPVEDRPPIAQEVALELIDEAVAAKGADAEVLVVAAAGNYGTTEPVYPAAFSRVISVAAVDQNCQPADWSSRGDRVDCSTIGVGVRSTYVEGTEWPALDATPDHFGPSAWALWAGTSFAAPQIAAEVARIADEHGYSLQRALTQVLSRGTPVPGFGRVVEILKPL